MSEFRKRDYKYVKKARMYVRTWFEETSSHISSQTKTTQKQEWISIEEYNALPD